MAASLRTHFMVLYVMSELGISVLLFMTENKVINGYYHNKLANCVKFVFEHVQEWVRGNNDQRAWSGH